MAESRQFNVAVKTPYGDLPPLQITVSNDPMRLSELVPLLHHLTDQAVGLAIAQVGREGKELSCRAGCGVCCHQLVPVNPAEVFYMVEKLLQMPLEKRKTPLERFERNQDALVPGGLIEAIGSLGTTGEINDVAREYFNCGLPCPFLENQSCAIHSWRPVACREYNVTSPPAYCANPFTNKIDTVPFRRIVSDGVGRLCGDVAGLPSGSIPMPQLFDYFETYREVSRRTFPGIELFEKMFASIFGEYRPENG
jgi:Fe-S-cluster containining protein